MTYYVVAALAVWVSWLTWRLYVHQIAFRLLSIRLAKALQAQSEDVETATKRCPSSLGRTRCALNTGHEGEHRAGAAYVWGSE